MSAFLAAAPVPNPSPAIMSVNGARVLADISGAGLVLDEGALLVADLHFEKGSAFAARGQFLPPYDTRATVKRLAEAIARLKPKTVIALGDSFHDLGAHGRMHGDDVAAIRSLVASVADWVWIEGNHDPAPPPDLGGRFTSEMRLGPLTLRHEPQPGPQPGEAAGHLHPCARVAARGRAVRRRCFLSDGRRLILPAFGAFTGGLNVRDEAFAPLFDTAPTAWMLGRERVYPVQARRCRGD
ncbi:MAG: ligase-associated DNA damage response endonuclease PdeM [Pseudomonadota bacterium]